MQKAKRDSVFRAKLTISNLFTNIRESDMDFKIINEKKRKKNLSFKVYNFYAHMC